jgi:hypothetical protein
MAKRHRRPHPVRMDQLARLMQLLRQLVLLVDLIRRSR